MALSTEYTLDLDVEADAAQKAAEAAECAFNASHWSAVEAIPAGVEAGRSISAVIAPRWGGGAAAAQVLAKSAPPKCSAHLLRLGDGSATVLARVIAAAVGAPSEAADNDNPLDAVRERLEQLAAFDAAVIFLVEDADRLADNALAMIERLAAHGRRLERLRRLNAGEDERTCPLGAKFVLFGGQELLDRLGAARDPSLRAAAANAERLRFFDPAEVGAYLKKRLRGAGREEALIEPAAIERCEAETSGSPELLGALCAHARVNRALGEGTPLCAAEISAIATELDFAAKRAGFDDWAVDSRRRAPAAPTAEPGQPSAQVEDFEDWIVDTAEEFELDEWIEDERAPAPSRPPAAKRGPGLIARAAGRARDRAARREAARRRAPRQLRTVTKGGASRRAVIVGATVLSLTAMALMSWMVEAPEHRAAPPAAAPVETPRQALSIRNAEPASEEMRPWAEKPADPVEPLAAAPELAPEIEGRLSAALTLADRRIAARQFTGPAGASAYDALIDVAYLAPGDPRLAIAFERIASHYEEQAEQALSREQFQDFYRLNALVDAIRARRSL